MLASASMLRYAPLIVILFACAHDPDVDPRGSDGKADEPTVVGPADCPDGSSDHLCFLGLGGSPADAEEAALADVEGWEAQENVTCVEVAPRHLVQVSSAVWRATLKVDCTSSVVVGPVECPDGTSDHLCFVGFAPTPTEADEAAVSDMEGWEAQEDVTCVEAAPRHQIQVSSAVWRTILKADCAPVTVIGPAECPDGTSDHLCFLGFGTSPTAADDAAEDDVEGWEAQEGVTCVEAAPRQSIEVSSAVWRATIKADCTADP